MYCFIRRKAVAAKPPLTLATVAQCKAPVQRVQAGKPRNEPCHGCKPGVRPGSRPAFLLRQKSGAKKATPTMAVRCADCTRRQCRNREASETRYAQTADASLSDFGTGDVSPS